MHCSGRSCGVLSLRATLNLKPRHDIFMSAANFFLESEDSVQAILKYTPRGDGGNTVYMLIIPQKLMTSAKLLHPEHSIGKFVKCELLSAAGLVLIADAPDYALSLLSKPVLQALVECAPVLSYLKISDRRQEDSSKGNDHRVAFETRLSHSSIAPSECYESSELCLRVALRLADVMSTQFVSPSERELLAGLRRKLEEKQTADKRKEAEALAQQKKQEKLDKAWAQVCISVLHFNFAYLTLNSLHFQVKALQATDPKKAAKEEEKILKKVTFSLVWPHFPFCSLVSVLLFRVLKYVTGAKETHHVLESLAGFRFLLLHMNHVTLLWMSTTVLYNKAGVFRQRFNWHSLLIKRGELRARRAAQAD